MSKMIKPEGWFNAVESADPFRVGGVTPGCYP
jgi:hypothetical protein